MQQANQRSGSQDTAVGQGFPRMLSTLRGCPYIGEVFTDCFD